MSEQTIEPPPVISGPSEDARARATFNEMMAAQPNEPPTLETPPVQEPPATEKPDDKPDDIPESVLLGTKPEPKPSEDDTILNETPKGQIAHENFKRLQDTAKKRIAAIERERDEAIAKAKDFESKTGQPTEEYRKQLEAEAQRRLALEEEISRVAVERSPQFKERFTAREDALRGQVKKVLSELGVNGSDTDALFRMSGPKRFEAIDGMEIADSARSYITGVLSQYDQIQEDKESTLARSREQLSAWETEQREKATKADQRRREEEDRLFEEVGREVASEFEPFQRVEGNDEWNKNIDDLKATALKFFNGEMDLKQVAKIAYYGVGAKFMHDKIVTRLRTELKSEREKNARLTAASPSLTPSTVKPGKDGRNLTPDERAAETFRQSVMHASNNGFAP